VKILAILFIFITSFNAYANDWFVVAKASAIGETHRVKTTSIYEEKNNGGEKITGAIFELETKNGSKISTFDRYVTNADCVRGYGEVYTLSTSGKFVSRVEFSMDGNSIASAIGTFLCRAFSARNESLSKKNQDTEETAAQKKWAETIEQFFDAEKNRQDGIDYRSNKKMLESFDLAVKYLANDPKNNDKTMLWFLLEADTIIKRAYFPDAYPLN
jgi:hypothetical protein